MDNGSTFTSSEFQVYLQDNLICHIRSAPFHHATDGQIERMVQMAVESLCRIMEKDWEYRLVTFLMGQRTTPSSATRHSPAELLMGQGIMTHLDQLYPDQVFDQRQPSEVKDAPQGFFPGDLVYTRNYSSPAWLPAHVVRVTGPVLYKVFTDNEQVLQRHIDQLWCRLLPDPGGAQPASPDEDLQND